MTTTNRRICAILFSFASIAAADQASFTSSGGAVTLASNFTISGASLANPAGTLTLSCPVIALPPGEYSELWQCVAGGTITIQSNDGSTTVNANITSGTVTLTASGGGRGNPTKYYYTFAGSFIGSKTQGGQQEAIFGSTFQALAGSTSKLGTGTIYSASTALNATYEQVYVADTGNSRIVRIDDITGDNWASVGKPGSGALHFNQPWGVFVDPAGKIYVTDSNNCRVVRMDDMSGTNWTSLGACGAGSLQFNSPSGIAVDSAGHIYVGDTGNNRIVRMDDMSGANWVALGGTAGHGPGLFNAPVGLALDTTGRVYVADSKNSQIVRTDDMSGTNWTTLTSIFNSGGGAPSGLSVDTLGRIYTVDTYNNRVLRADDMTGANVAVLGGTFGAGVDQFINPSGVSVDQFGTIFVADSHDNRIVLSDDMTGLNWTAFGTCCLSVGQFNLPDSLFAVPPSVPTPVAVLSAAKLSYSDQVVGTSSATQVVALANIGSAPLVVANISTAGDFSQTNTCLGSLPPGTSCSVSVAFTPSAAGRRTGSIGFALSGSTARTVSLTGIASLVAVSPTSLNFGNVRAGDGKGASLPVTISNPGPNSAGIASIKLTGAKPFHLTSTCSATLASGANCTVTVTFRPQAVKYYTATLTIKDAAGVAQKVAITGVGYSN